MKKLLLFLVLIYSVTLSSAQITMINGGSNSVTTATTFYDPGGIANYANNLNVTHTICPGTAGRYVRISFSAFNTELNFDYLYVYNGTTVCTSTLLATLTGTSIPADIISSAPGGCLTFVFVSDATTRRAGFTASLTQQTTIGGTAYVACPTPPTNDNPCAAISLGTINSLCTNTSGTVTLATGSTGVPVPSCGPTLAPFTDVWYYFDATATGTNIQTEALTGTTDMTMQVLTNSSGCAGTWTQLGCDDDNNPSNAMPYLSVSGTTPNPITTVIGQRYYVRVFPYSSGSAGTFNICAYNVQRPNCTSNATPATGSTVGTLRPTLTWNAASLASGYDVYLGTSNPPTTIVSTNQSATSYTPPANLLGDTT